MVKAVIFDLGRVLIHYDHDLTLAGIAAVSKLPPGDARAIMEEIAGPLGTGKMSAQDLHRLLVQRAGTVDDFEQFLQAFCRGMQRDEEALAYAVALEKRPGVRVGIISNANHAHAIWLRNNLPELDQLSAVLLSNDVGLLKPDPAIFLLAVQRLRVEPANALFVDDLEENVRGAKAVGMHGIVHRSWEETRRRIESWLAE